MPGTKERDKVESLTEIYWRDIRDTQPLSRRDEVDLFTRIKQGDEEAREKVITANLRFVVSVAREYKDYGLSLLELVSEGNVGLLEAVKRFDETRGFKFITYAVWWIRQAILKALAENGRIARPPMSQVNDLQKLEKEAGVLAQRLGREPTDIELCEHVDISWERTRNAIRISQQDLSFDAPVFPDEDTTLHAVIGSEDEGVDEALDERESKRRIADCLEVLDEREYRIVRDYYGFGNLPPMTLEQIGGSLGVTRERVRQLRNRALEKLRESCGETLVQLSEN